MLSCPHCKHTLGFLEFVTGYGSDTLLKHSRRAHAHEHKCLHCHRVIWIHYDRARMDLWSLQWGLTWLAFALVLTFFGAGPLLELTPGKQLLFVVILMFLGYPVIVTYARYLTADFREEKEK